MFMLTITLLAHLRKIQRLSHCQSCTVKVKFPFHPMSFNHLSYFQAYTVLPIPGIFLPLTMTYIRTRNIDGDSPLLSHIRVPNLCMNLLVRQSDGGELEAAAMDLYSLSRFSATQYKILGGANAVPGEFPYQAQLQYMNHHFCGATIISSVLILTAAHCVINKRKEELTVVVGRLESNPTEDLTGYRRDIRMVFIHENYNRRTHDHDIAILLLSHEFHFSRLIRPLLIRRTTSQNARRGIATVTGWGKQSEDSSFSAPILQKVSVPLVSQESCQRAYAAYGQNITEDMICAGEEGKDSCQGDSGGPLTCITKDGHKFLCGIASFGIGCGRQEFPGVYTDVSRHYEWIERTAANINAFFRCPANHFRCRRNWKCITIPSMCNQVNDCEDNSDEEDCAS